jgi:hypothetical protein
MPSVLNHQTKNRKGKIMTIKIALVVALCSNVSMDKIQAKMKELEAKNPGAKITLRIDKKASCESK